MVTQRRGRGGSVTWMTFGARNYFPEDFLPRFAIAPPQTLPPLDLARAS